MLSQHSGQTGRNRHNSQSGNSNRAPVECNIQRSSFNILYSEHPIRSASTNPRLLIYTSYYQLSPQLHIYAYVTINPLNAELNPICYLLALLAHHFLHVSRIRVKSLTLKARCHGDSLRAASASGKWSWPVATAALSTYTLTRIAPPRVEDRATLPSCYRSRDLRAGM